MVNLKYKYSIFFTVGLFVVYTIYGAELPFNIKKYPCNVFQQAYFVAHDETKIILNTQDECSIVSLDDKQEKKILFQHEKDTAHYLVAHPEKTLIALSDTGNIIILNYDAGDAKSFSTKNRQDLVSVGKFNTRNSTFYYDTGEGLFFLDYASSDASTYQLDISTGNSSTWGMNRPLDYYIAFDPKENAICVATNKPRITVCNEDDILAKKLSERSKEYELELKKCYFFHGFATKRPFFCEYALGGSLLICAVQNYNHCKEITLFNTRNQYKKEKTIAADNKTSFVQMALHPNGIILATLSRPGVLLQFWNVITGTSLGEAIRLYAKNDKNFDHFYEFFMSYSLTGKRIVVGKTNGNKYKIVEMSDEIVIGLYKNIMPSYPIGVLILQSYGLMKELKNLIIKKLLELSMVL